ncbi:gliding motility lipoprotein GldH [Mucilaginibacter sp. Bleaf8]|uniref:gliding motility lipoprotein GldH n=1 Tax=Mucilaginibacter sp. Bleaf8 TaxID=2834430 RepID=UPI001BCAA25D|nr:gliding motility lipoprotein GldH [Mucilaginibacter sp. Bleaf8]MBS7565603.1 gliding motility lipoprotein GldH [Mucilaginibacter sp. Bleaf8]
MSLRRKLLSTLFIAAMAAAGCGDTKAVMDNNTEIPNQNWSYGKKITYDVAIDDPNIAYNLCFNVRVTASYRYSNMFVIIQESGGPLKKKGTRYEFKLASPTGEWLGKGSGSMYSYQMPFKTQYRFPAKGTYHFEIEQNMRDNPLKAVNDVGLRIEKAE